MQPVAIPFELVAQDSYGLGKNGFRGVHADCAETRHADEPHADPSELQGGYVDVGIEGYANHRPRCSRRHSLTIRGTSSSVYPDARPRRSEEHTSELQSLRHLV